jgi:glycosyltransferase involved in cell wall biosynthesis
MYDKIIVISDHLNNYYSPLFVKKTIFQIPILVDMERFSGVFEQRDKDEKVITYIGFMGGDKDGLSNLIEALALVKEKGMSFKAQLVGSGPEEDLNRLKKKISDLKLSDTIVFLGSKTIKEIPSILLRSDLLVLSRPDNNQAKAGFPTKLGEYLASKKPVIITKTGEISKYLKDNESAYLVAAGDNESFAEKIICALNDPKAFEIGSNGYNVANTNFNYKVYKGTLNQLFN